LNGWVSQAPGHSQKIVCQFLIITETVVNDQSWSASVITATIRHMSKKKPGRPKKTANRMEAMVQVKTTPAQKQEWQDHATRMGMDLSEWIRKVCDDAIRTHADD
jgi:hypothetical protein